MCLRLCNIPKTAEVDLLGPDIRIETLTPILIKHQGVGVVDNGAETIINEIAGDGKTQSKSDQGDNGDPFLPWVFLVLPRMVDIPLLDPSRAEVFLVLLLLMEVNGR